MTRILAAAALTVLVVILWPSGWRSVDPMLGLGGHVGVRGVRGLGGAGGPGERPGSGQASRSRFARPPRPEQEQEQEQERGAWARPNARPRWRPRTPGSRRAEAARHTDEILDLLDALGPALRAGLAPSAALRAVAPAAFGRPADGAGVGALDRSTQRSLVGSLVSAADRGEPLSAVWRARAEASASPDLRLIAGAWLLCERLGSPLAPTVTTVGEVVRQQRGVRRRMDAALAGPRASMTVLSGLPVVGPLLAIVMGIGPLDLVASTAAGLSVAAGVALLLLGRWWSARLVGGIRVDGGPAARRGGADLGWRAQSRRRRHD